MKKLLKLLTMMCILAMVFSFAACTKNDGNEETTAESTESSSNETTTAKETRKVKTYLNWTFDDLEDGSDIPNVAVEGAGFKVVKEGNNGWAVSKNPKDWAAIYFGVPGDDGKEIYLQDFCIETKIFLPENNDGEANDGGVCLFVSQEGRYDAAIAYGTDKSYINIWKAGNTDGGPIATNDKANYPERGWVADFKLEPGKSYIYTIMGKYRKDTEGNEFVKVYAFVDSALILEHEIPYWKGGFGLRGWKSAIRYDYVKVSDLPLVCPDGVARFD